MATGTEILMDVITLTDKVRRLHGTTEKLAARVE